jgi:hypothetical protein
MTRQTLAVALIAALALTACGKQQPPPTSTNPATPAQAPAAPAPSSTPAPAAPAAPASTTANVESLTLGSALNADGKITAPATTFSPKDTIYAQVATSGGSGNAAVSARWTFGQGQVVSENNESVAAGGNATTTFHISKPDGFPAGMYKVDISVDGKPAKSASFEVK